MVPDFSSVAVPGFSSIAVPDFSSIAVPGFPSVMVPDFSSVAAPGPGIRLPIYKRGRAANTASWPSIAGRFPPRVASRPSAVGRSLSGPGPAPGPLLARPPECPDKAGRPRRWPSGALQRPPASSTKIGKITSRIEKIGVNAFFLAKNIFFQKICLYLQSQTERFSVAGNIWRDAGVVDRAALEMRCTGNCTGGSNPSLSARHTKVAKNPVNHAFTGFFIFGKSAEKGI